MAKNQANYKNMEFVLTIALIAAAVLFVIYLIAAGCGVIWLKVVVGVLAIIVSILSLVLLYFSGELLKQRSLWMSVGFAAVIVCILFSLILNYPSPNPYKDQNGDSNVPALGAMIITGSDIND